MDLFVFAFTLKNNCFMVSKSTCHPQKWKYTKIVVFVLLQLEDLLYFSIIQAIMGWTNRKYNDNIFSELYTLSIIDSKDFVFLNGLIGDYSQNHSSAYTMYSKAKCGATCSSRRNFQRKAISKMSSSLLPRVAQVYGLWLNTRQKKKFGQSCCERPVSQ